MFSKHFEFSGERDPKVNSRENDAQTSCVLITESRPIVPLVNPEFVISYSVGARIYARARAYAVCALRSRTGESFLRDIERGKGQPTHGPGASFDSSRRARDR